MQFKRIHVGGGQIIRSTTFATRPATAVRAKSELDLDYRYGSKVRLCPSFRPVWIDARPSRCSDRVLSLNTRELCKFVFLSTDRALWLVTHILFGLAT